MLLMLWVVKGWTQNITNVEYFFDTDPGSGAGVQVDVVPPSPNLSNFNFSVNISGLNDGFHELFVRAKDENGVWSHSNNRAFYKNTITSPLHDLTKVEYFFDTDPGTGLGTNVPFTPGPDIPNLDFSIDISGLPDGFHHLFVRTKNQFGAWSFANRRPFLKQVISSTNPLLTKAEYFIDTDPGFGMGTSVPINPNGSNVTLDFTIDLSSLPDGFHHLYTRVKDTEGLWSLASRRPFMKQSVTPVTTQLTEIEYFIDTDPGFGQGTSVPIIPNGSNITADFAVDLTPLTDGFHQFSVRVKDTEGLWSLASQRSFIKQSVAQGNQQVTRIEYFFDSDPGFGNGTSIPITPSTDVTITNHIIDITSITDGIHKLFVRAENEGGVWSLTNIWGFYKRQLYSAVPNLVAAEYFFNNDPGLGQGISIPVPGNSNLADLTFVANLTSLNEGSNRLFVRTKDATGRWSHNSIHYFYKKTFSPTLPDIVYAEYFIDSDPGMELGINIPVTNPGPNVTDLTFQVDQSQLVMGNHMLFLRTKDENGRWSLTLMDQFCHSPQADFSANNVWLGNLTTFTDLSTSTNQYTQYNWDVNGDNVTDYTYNHGFTHLYTAAGTYNARLILISQEGCPDTIVKQVSVFICTQPTALSVSDTTENSAILHWIQANMETTWNIEYGLTGYTQGTGTPVNNVQSNSCLLSGLAANTTYDFYVQSACTQDSISSWAGPATFTTLDGAPCSNPTFGGLIAASQTICYGTVPDPYTSISPATGYTGVLEYKWQLSTDNLAFNDIPISNSESYSYNNALSATTWFRRLARVTCQPDWTGAAVSDTIQVSIDARNRYRTKASGDWDNPATWEYFNGTQWVDAADYPSSVYITCPNPLATVQNGHTINLGTSVEFGNVVVDEGGILEVQNNIALGIISGDTLTVNGTLIMHTTAIVNGAGHFWIIAGGTIHIGAVAGINVSTVTGNIQVSGSRIYSSGAHYVYIGTANQLTGDALIQNTPGNITINVPGFTVTLSQAIVISGNIHVIQGTLDVNNYNITLGGNWTNDGIFLPGTATVYFSCTVNVYIGVSNFYNVVFSGSDTITAAGSLTVYGDLTINNYFSAGTFTHYVYGNWVNNGIFIYGTSTIQFMGTGNYFISISNFYNIIFAGTGTYTATGSLTIYGYITINNYFDAGTYTHYVYGNWTNNGTFVYGTSTIQFVGTGNIYIGVSNFYNVVFACTGTVIASGQLTFYGNVTINNYFDAGAFVHYVYGNWINNGNFIYGTSTINFVGTGTVYIGASTFYNIIFSGTGTYVANGSITIYGDITITTNFYAVSYTISVYGNWVNNGLFDYGTSTVEFIGSGNVTITQNDFYNVIFGGTGIFIATGSLNFYGNVTINSTFDAGSFIHYVYGNWIVNGVFVYGTSTICFTGTINIYVGVSNFYNVVFAGTGTITATGSLTIFGDITISNYFDAGSFSHYIYGNWINNGVFVYSTSTINFVGTGNIFISINNFYSVVFAGTGTVTATGSITFYGDVIINNYFDAAFFTHYVYGSWTVNGTFIYGTSTIHFLGTGNVFIGISNFYNIIFAGTGTITATGSLTIFGDVTITTQFNGGSYNHYVYGNWINTGIYVYGTSTINFIGTGNILLSENEFYNVIFAGTGTVVATGSITFYGSVTINNYFDAGSFIHYVHGSWTVNGIFVYGTSTIHFTGTGNAFIGLGNFYHVVFGGSGTITALGSLTIYGNVTITNHFSGGAFVHYIYGNWTNSGTFVYGTSTIHFVGTGSISISESDFYHIVFAGTGTIVSTGSFSVYGDVTINNYWDAGSFIHYVYGNWYNNGIFVYSTSTIHFSGTGNIFLSQNEFYHIVFGGTGIITATGSLTIYGNVSITNYFHAGSYIHYVYGSWTNSGTFVHGTSSIQFVGTGNILVGASNFYHIIFASSGTVVATGTLHIYGDMTITNQFDADSYDHYVYGNWYNNGIFVHGNSTIHFVGSGNVNIGSGNFYNIVFAGSGTITATGSLTIYGNVILSNYFNAGSYIHYIYGNWTNNGTFVRGTSIIVYCGTLQQIIDGLYESDFYGFTLNNSMGLLLYTNLNVHYSLSLTLGIITAGSYIVTVLPTGSITGGSATSYIHGRLRCGYNAIGSRIFPVGTAFNYGPVTLNYNTLSGTSLVQVEFAEGTISGSIPDNITNVADHYWIISQTGGFNFTFTLTFNVYGFIPMGTVRMLRGNGIIVNAYATTAPNYTNVDLFDTFGDFTLGDIYCALPSGLVNRYITLTSAILDWEPGDQEQEWNVEYGPAGFIPGTGTLLTNVTSRPLEIIGLTPQSYYEFYVQSVCSAEVQSPWTGPEPFSTFPKQLNAKIFLEGPYDASMDLMQTNLSNAGVIPLSQPYQGSPWYYSGNEQVATIPSGVVDWILLEWRDAPSPGSANSSTYIWRKAAFMRNNGSVVDMDGNSLPWIGNPQLSGSLYIVVQHRNHLDVIGNFGAILQNEIYSYDFSDQLEKVYGGNAGYKQIGTIPLRFGMIAGDGNADGQVLLNQDINVIWNLQSGMKGYRTADFDMNGQVQNQDKNDTWRPNIGKNSSVP